MKNIIYIIVVAIVVKICYVLFSFGYNEITENGYKMTSINDILDVYKKNDSYWYEMVATNGHHKITPDQLGKCEDQRIEQSYYVFMPLYPAIVGLTMKLFNIGFNSAAIFFSFIFSLTCFLLFYVFGKKYFGDEKKAFWATLILILFPFHYYFSVFYTESLYLLLLLGCFIAIHKKKNLIFSLLLGLLALVRPNGLFMAIPLFIYFFEQNYSLSVKMIFKRKLREYLPLLTFLSAPIVMAGYGLYLYQMTGDFFANFHARVGWCQYSTLPWEPILQAKGWSDYFKIAYTAFFTILSLYFIKKIPLYMHALIWINLLLPLTLNTITVPRFISCIFIFSLIFGSLLMKVKLPIRIVLLIILFLGQLYTFTFWLEGNAFSF